MLKISYFCLALFVLVGEGERGRRGLWTHNPPPKSDLFMNSSPGFPPPFSPCRPQERARACQKSLADVYRTGLAISHGALWYLIYIRPDMGELKGLFWDIPHRWIWFLQLEQFPKYVPPSRFWSVLTVNGQSLILHTFSRHVLILFRKHSCKIIGGCTTMHLDQPTVMESKKYSWLFVHKSWHYRCAQYVMCYIWFPKLDRLHMPENVWCNKIQYLVFGSCFFSVCVLKQK